jgi:hypothetical protein
MQNNNNDNNTTTITTNTPSPCLSNAFICIDFIVCGRGEAFEIWSIEHISNQIIPLFIHVKREGEREQAFL